LNYTYRNNLAIHVVELDTDTVENFDKIEDFCDKFHISEAVARRYIKSQVTFMPKDSNHKCYIAFQEKFDPSKGCPETRKLLTKAFGESKIGNQWELYRVNVNPNTDNDNQVTVSARTIYLTDNYLSITNNKGLNCRYPYVGFVVEKEQATHEEAKLYFKGKCLGLYTTERGSDKYIVLHTSKDLRKIQVVAKPIIADEEQVNFESISEAASFFEVFPVTIRHHIKMGAPIDKDKVFYTLECVGA